MILEVGFGIAISVAVYVERRTLKAKLAAAEAAVVAKAENIESSVRAEIRAKFAAVIADLKTALQADVVEKVEAAFKSII